MQRNSPGGSTRRRASSVKSRYGDTLFIVFMLRILYNNSVRLRVVKVFVYETFTNQEIEYFIM